MVEIKVVFILPGYGFNYHQHDNGEMRMLTLISIVENNPVQSFLDIRTRKNVIAAVQTHPL